MSLTESEHLQANWKAPDFELFDTTGKLHVLNDLIGPKGLVLVFTCNHCPFAKAIWPRLIDMQVYYKSLGISFVAINPNINPAYPQDSPQNMFNLIQELSLPFPYLVDTNQEVAKLYQAKCTPDIYLIQANKILFYHGQLDDCWKDKNLVSRHDLKENIELLLKNLPAKKDQKPSVGCSIKWC